MSDESQLRIQACGSRVAVLFLGLDENVMNGLVIWDWKSGQQKLVRLAASYFPWYTEGL